MRFKSQIVLLVFGLLPLACGQKNLLKGSKNDKGTEKAGAESAAPEPIAPEAASNADAEVRLPIDVQGAQLLCDVTTDDEILACFMHDSASNKPLALADDLKVKWFLGQSSVNLSATKTILGDSGTIYFVSLVGPRRGSIDVTFERQTQSQRFSFDMINLEFLDDLFPVGKLKATAVEDVPASPLLSFAMDSSTSVGDGRFSLEDSECADAGTRASGKKAHSFNFNVSQGTGNLAMYISGLCGLKTRDGVRVVLLNVENNSELWFFLEPNAKNQLLTATMGLGAGDYVLSVVSGLRQLSNAEIDDFSFANLSIVSTVPIPEGSKPFLHALPATP